MRKSILFIYLAMILLGILSGLSEVAFVHAFGQFVSDVFIRIFKCLSAPIIALSLIVTISMSAGVGIGKMWKRTITYTISTTIVAALISMLFYLLISPANITGKVVAGTTAVDQTSYFHYLANLVPTNFFSPFVDNQVISVLLLALVVGFAIRHVPDAKAKESVMQLFKGLHGLLFVITKWVVVTLPLALFGFISVSVTEFKSGMNIHSIGQYLAVIILANLTQGLIVLPLWLKYKGIRPFHSLKSMMPALTVAFFSKSSAGTLPLTMETAERGLKLRPEVSRFVLPLCTSLNMNGCAAFIFTTIIFVMQNNGVEISLLTMLAWVFIATLAAIGNAGVPMGCFFLSASLLASMNIPIILLGVILPFYGVIDMVETALNVWSDSCVANMVNKDSLSPVFENEPVAQGVV